MQLKRSNGTSLKIHRGSSECVRFHLKFVRCKLSLKHLHVGFCAASLAILMPVNDFVLQVAHESIIVPIERRLVEGDNSSLSNRTSVWFNPAITVYVKLILIVDIIRHIASIY